MKLNIFIWLAALLCFKSNAQQVALDRFTATTGSNHVVLQWTIAAGSSCNGISILRSADSISFSVIGSIEGICGSSSSPVSYQFTDNNPIPNRISYYRLRLGTLELSHIVNVEFINISSLGYFLRPNPVNDACTIFFSNKLNVEFTFSLFDMTGKNVCTIENITGDELIFYRNTLPAGVFLFTLENKSGIGAKGKLVIQ